MNRESRRFLGASCMLCSFVLATLVEGCRHRTLSYKVGEALSQLDRNQIDELPIERTIVLAYAPFWEQMIQFGPIDALLIGNGPMEDERCVVVYSANGSIIGVSREPTSKYRDEVDDLLHGR